MPKIFTKFFIKAKYSDSIHEQAYRNLKFSPTYKKGEILEN